MEWHNLWFLRISSRLIIIKGFNWFVLTSFIQICLRAYNCSKFICLCWVRRSPPILDRRLHLLFDNRLPVFKLYLIYLKIISLIELGSSSFYSNIDSFWVKVILRKSACTPQRSIERLFHLRDFYWEVCVIERVVVWKMRLYLLYDFLFT